MIFQQYPVTIILIAANVISSLIGFYNTTYMDKAIMWPYVVKRKNQYHRFVSSGFLHADFMHLFFNMFTLFFFGASVERHFMAHGLGGNAAYLLLYFTALIVSDIPTYIKHKDNYNYKALGASGAVSAIVFASIVFDPWSSLYLYGAIKLSALVFAVLYIVYCVYMGRKSNDNVNHDAHLWGAIYGLVFTLLLIWLLQPSLFGGIMYELQHPSFFGN
ncbi:MAG: rhomboid family intramembrane serine protease [Ferruginibacter sp.]